MLELGDEHEAGHRAGRRRPRPASSTGSSSSATGARRDRAGARAAPGWPPTRVVEVAGPRGGAGRSSAATLAPGDVVLVKASRGVALDLLVDDLVAALGGPGAPPMTVELIQGLLLAFAIVVILMPPYIRLLRATGFTKQIRIEGPDSHQVKHGTPTMGGALIIVVVLALYLLLRWPPEGGIYAPLGDARRRRRARRVRRLPEREDRRGDPRPPEAALAGRRSPFAAAFLIQRTYADRPDRRPVRRRRSSSTRRSTSSSRPSRSSPRATA